MLNKIHNENCLDTMRRMPDNYIDLIVTDPPYALTSVVKRFGNNNSKEAQFGTDGLYKRMAGGFMGKKWDSETPSVEIWKEALRVLKPGAFAFICMTSRQDSLAETIFRLTEAGFNTGFSSIYWTYSSGFPKSHNISKKIDKNKGLKRDKIKGGAGSRGNTFISLSTEALSTEALSTDKLLDGAYGGFQPKPAVEIIIVVMKPLTEKTYVEQALNNGHGITWLDDCRIPFESIEDKEQFEKPGGYPSYNLFNIPKIKDRENSKGRVMANLLVSDDVLNDNKNGSYSRYFDLDKWSEINGISTGTFPFIICPKASKREKNKGCGELEGHQHQTNARTYDDVCANCGKKLFGDIPFRCSCETKITQKRITKGNSHPTCKPLKLMSYLITLGSREGEIVYDPFSGSGTTLLAAKNLKRNYIGSELEAEYIPIINARLSSDENYMPSNVKDCKTKFERCDPSFKEKKEVVDHDETLSVINISDQFFE